MTLEDLFQDVHHYTATIDTLILILLLIWCYMDRHNIYINNDDQ